MFVWGLFSYTDLIFDLVSKREGGKKKCVFTLAEEFPLDDSKCKKVDDATQRN